MWSQQERRFLCRTTSCKLPWFQSKKWVACRAILMEPKYGVNDQQNSGRCPILHSNEVNHSEFDRLANGMEKAIKKYEKAALFGEDCGPHLVADNVTITTFEQWSSQVESRWTICFLRYSQSCRGRVVLFGDPSLVHESVTRSFEAMLVHQVALKGFIMADLVRFLGSTDQKIPQGVKQPDCSYASMSKMAPPLVFPRLILEVAFQNESLRVLEKEINCWHETGVILSLGIKISTRESGSTMFWVQQHISEKEATIKNFSPGVCNEVNQDNFVVRFPLSYIMEDISVEDDFLLTIDLFQLQNRIMGSLLFQRKQNQSIILVKDV